MTRASTSACGNPAIHGEGPDELISDRRLTVVARYGSPVPFPPAGTVSAPYTSCHFCRDRVVGNRGSVASELKRGRRRAEWLHLPPQGTVALGPQIGRPT